MRTVKVLLASAVLGAAALPAAAQVPAPASGNGGLAFIGFDAVRGTSLFQYLDLTLDQVQPGTFTSGSFVLSGYSTAFGASNAGDIRWMVVAGDSDGFGGGPDYLGEQYDSLRLAATTLNGAAAQSNIGLEAGLANLEDFITLRVNGAAGCSGTNPCIGTSSADARYAGVLQGQLNGLAGGAPALNFNTLGTVTDTLNFFLFAGTGAGAQTPSVRTAYSGLFSLTGNVLSFAGASVVPLPAGVWLLLSGIAGLVTVARRRTGDTTLAAA